MDNEIKEASIIIFVYGTLMKGMGNHDFYLSDSRYLGKGVLDGYRLYELGSYPGIKAGDGSVLGEVYEVTPRTLDGLNELEGEGFLYKLKYENITLESGGKIRAGIYEYLRTVDPENYIPVEKQPWKKVLAERQNVK
jgi:Uncharacterized conserved protein